MFKCILHGYHERVACLVTRQCPGLNPAALASGVPHSLRIPTLLSAARCRLALGDTSYYDDRVAPDHILSHHVDA